MANVIIDESSLYAIADSIREKNGTENTYTPAEMSSAIDDLDVGGITPTGTKTITANGTYDVTEFASADVNVPSVQPALNTKSITANGTYLAEDDNLDGYSEVTVNIPSVTPTGTKQISITQNGTTTEDVTNYASAEITANVANSYTQSDEGKVVSSGALVSQTSDTVTANDTYDTTLINSLTVNVSGSGGTPGSEFDWASSKQVITIGENSITNTAGVQSYFSSYTYDMAILLDALTENNQFVAFLKTGAARYRNNAIATVSIGNNYDAKLVEGTRYLLIAL